MIPAAELGCEETGGFFSPRTPEPGPAGSWTSSWRCCKLGITNNMRLELLCRQESSRAIRKQRGFLKNELVRFSGNPRCFPLCACAQAGRQSRPARERHVFVLLAPAEHCLRNKSYTIRKRRGPGRSLLPGGVWGSAPAFPYYASPWIFCSQSMMLRCWGQALSQAPHCTHLPASKPFCCKSL